MKPEQDEESLLRWLRARAEPGRTDAGRTDAGRTDAGRADAGRAYAGRTALLGDDAALLPGLPAYAVSVDQQIEGVHFPKGLAAEWLAPRLLEVCLSDLAASGARPVWCLLALAAPPDFAHRRFFRAFLAALERRGVRLVGGDLSAASSVRMALTVCGTRPRRGRWLRRGTAKAGQQIWVGGTLGESAAGCRLLALGARASGRRMTLPEGFAQTGRLATAARRALSRHLRPTAQLELGQWLGLQRAGAAMDVSDGLARDLYRLCRESQTGARIVAEELPRAPGFDALAARLGEQPLSLVLGGGEDYVLLFTLPKSAQPPERFGCRRIGTVTAARQLTLVEGGRSRALPRLGFDHLRKVRGRPAVAPS